MKLRLINIVIGLVASIGSAFTANATFVNLTPTPKQMTVGEGSLTLPATFNISHTGLNADMVKEIDKFIATFNHATGLTATTSTTTAGSLFGIELDSSIAPEGYSLDITTDGVTVKASAPAGLYYAFQTIKKILPANVALGIQAAGTYALPVVKIVDEPRYPWRGFELDVARHYFDVAQIKKMLDIMAVYKMNRFHWHLTDDQGWRFEMPKYPKLTTEAAAPLNAYWWDFDNHRRYTTNEMYGPYFYTVEEMQEIVEYAKERHIEVCPEVDMPGHMQAAIAAYPEFSTTPDAPHPVRYYPGVSRDVLDISNPAVVQFTKDIIDELASIFPYEYIHIGGDECPTDAWAASESCQQFKKEYGLTSDRALQNWLTKELADYAREKHNRKLICWNEVLTSAGADKEMVRNADILIYAWLGAGSANNPSKQAADLGLRSVWCSTSYYYLDYPQWSGDSEPVSMGGTVNLQSVYNVQPDYEASKKDLYYGVNCNLWTEYISEGKHLEYNALPRMIAVAETGWSPRARRNFDDFLTRFNADTEMLDLGNYTYGRHYVESEPEPVVMPEAGKFYRLVTRASADANRRDRCIELVREGSPLISSKSAQVGQLWTNTQAAQNSEDYNWQYWTFEADPDNPGNFAMVNRQAPDGSVNPNMSGTSVSARWSYDNNAKHYDFILGEHFGTEGINHYYSIRSDKGENHWMNCAQAAQNLTVNNWSDPTDGNGGLWIFSLEGSENMEPATVHPAFTPLENNGLYTFLNLKPETAGVFLTTTDTELSTSTAVNAAWSNKVWVVEAADYDSETNVQTMKLRNAASGLYIGALEANATNTVAEAEGYNGFTGINNGGYGITTTDNVDNAAVITLYKLSDDTPDMVLEIDGKSLFAFGEKSTLKPNGVNAREGASVQQGASWSPTPVSAENCGVYILIDAGVTEIDRYFRSEKITDIKAETCPRENYELISVEPADPATDEITGYAAYNVNVRLTNAIISYEIKDANGMSFDTVKVVVPIGEPYTPAAPELNFLGTGRIEGDSSPVTPQGDMLYSVIYPAFEGVVGVKQIGAAATALEPGKIYVIHDEHATRHAYRYASGAKVYGMREIGGASPAATWTLEPGDNDDRFYVKNLGNDLYIQALKSSVTATLGSEPYAFRFAYSDDHWSIKNSRNTMYWDGNEDANLSMVGWQGGTGHPYAFYPVTVGEPYFRLTIVEQDQNGNTLSSRIVCVKPGNSYIFAAASRPGKTLVGVTGDENLAEITGNKRIVVTYETDQNAITEITADGNPAGSRGIYDLQGHKLSGVNRPGIYIINGKKVKL